MCASLSLCVCVRVYAYVCACVRAGFGDQQKHSIYLWDRHVTNLVKILEGPKDALEDLAVR
jgi:hypothetical protein